MLKIRTLQEALNAEEAKTAGRKNLSKNIFKSSSPILHVLVMN